MRGFSLPIKYYHLLFILVIILLISTPVAWSATYYIDHASGNDGNVGISKTNPWKRVPGMKGFSGNYSHSAGDIFIFKGGVTWTGVFPWIISYSGSSGKIDTYTTDHTWYTGGAWSRPVFDDQGKATSGGMIQAESKNYFKLQDLEIANHETCGAPSGKAIQFANSQQFTIDSCKIHAYDWISIWIYFTNSGSYSNINITNNDVSTTSALTWIASTAGSTTVDTINILNNRLYDGTCGMANDVHADGLLHIFGIPTFNPNQRFINVVIAYNYVYGDWGKYDQSSAGWTSFVYNEASASAKIYNNVIAPDPEGVFMGEGFLIFSAVNNETVEMYNNTLVNTGFAGVVTAGIKGGAYGAGSSFVSEGNLVYGINNSQFLYNNGSNTSNYNCFDGVIQGYTGGDSNTITDNLLLVNPPSDVSLQSTSPCIDAFPTAQAPTSDFTDDFTLASRNQGNAWDVGAYEHNNSSSVNPPNPPTNFRKVE